MFRVFVTRLNDEVPTLKTVFCHADESDIGMPYIIDSLIRDAFGDLVPAKVVLETDTTSGFCYLGKGRYVSLAVWEYERVMMSEFLPMTAQREIEAGVHRLTTARRLANLSPQQADRRLSLETGTISRFERGEVEPTLRMFLILCELYNVSPAWILTGVNPYVNIVELVNLIYATRDARDKLEEIHSLIDRVPANDEYRQVLQMTDGEVEEPVNK